MAAGRWLHHRWPASSQCSVTISPKSASRLPDAQSSTHTVAGRPLSHSHDTAHFLTYSLDRLTLSAKPQPTRPTSTPAPQSPPAAAPPVGRRPRSGGAARRTRRARRLRQIARFKPFDFAQDKRELGQRVPLHPGHVSADLPIPPMAITAITGWRLCVSHWVSVWRSLTRPVKLACSG